MNTLKIFSFRFFRALKDYRCVLVSLTQSSFVMVACEQQTHFRSSLLYFSEGEKRRREMRLLFAGYRNGG